MKGKFRVFLNTKFDRPSQEVETEIGLGNSNVVILNLVFNF